MMRRMIAARSWQSAMFDDAVVAHIPNRPMVLRRDFRIAAICAIIKGRKIPRYFKRKAVDGCSGQRH